MTKAASNDVSPERSLIESQSFRARAVLIGHRLDFSSWKPAKTHIALQPLVVHVDGGGIAVLFKCGVVVFFDVTADDEKRFTQTLQPLVVRESTCQESEEFWIRVSSEDRETIIDNLVSVTRTDAKRLQIISEAFCRSIVLAEYELQIAESFDRIEPLGLELHTRGRTTRAVKRLLSHIGESLLSEQRMVGRAEVRDKPEILWENSHLEPLYLRLIEELEINERHSVLERKIGLVSRTATTALELLQTQRGHRLEWYIIILIVIEVLLACYELFFT